MSTLELWPRQLMTISESRNIDRPENRELYLLAELALYHNSLVHWPQLLQTRHQSIFQSLISSPFFISHKSYCMYTVCQLQYSYDRGSVLWVFLCWMCAEWRVGEAGLFLKPIETSVCVEHLKKRGCPALPHFHNATVREQIVFSLSWLSLEVGSRVALMWVRTPRQRVTHQNSD